MGQKADAARFHYRNCTVTIKEDGELVITRGTPQSVGAERLGRDFTPEIDPATIISQENEFYQFLSLTSFTNRGMLLKCAAIGYMLCNNLPRGGKRSRSFVCCNENDRATANGKSLFCRGVGELSKAVYLDGRRNRRTGGIDLRGMDEQTTVAIFDDITLSKSALERFYQICPGEWRISRREDVELILEGDVAPYVLISTNTPAWKFLADASARRRFIPLEFSSYFGETNRIEEHFGHQLFTGWDTRQWHLFDNFMIYCVREYLRIYSQGKDIFQII